MARKSAHVSGQGGLFRAAARRALLGLCGALALAGCVTVSNSLSPDQVQSLRYAGVNVVYAPDAHIWWGDGERAYAASKGVSVFSAEAAGKTPEGQAYLRGQITSKLKTAMERNLAGKLTGSRPVRIEVVVKDVTIASALQRIVVGGQHTMKGDINLVDIKTGAVVSSYPAQSAMSVAGQGIGGTLVDGLLFNDPLDRVIGDYAAQYRNWLLGA